MTDSQHRNSDFERNDKDKYYTEYWCSEALMRALLAAGISPAFVWEPAAGGGHIVEVLEHHGRTVFASDLDTRDYQKAANVNFLTEVPADMVIAPPDAIITNPPYKDDLAELFCRRALEYLGPDKETRTVAMLMRSDFKHASSRTYLWDRTRYPFAFEVVLTARPRWDAWYTGIKAEHSGMHNYSWYVWNSDWEGNSTQFFEGKNVLKKKPRTNLGKEVDALYALYALQSEFEALL